MDQDNTSSLQLTLHHNHIFTPFHHTMTKNYKYNKHSISKVFSVRQQKGHLAQKNMDILYPAVPFQEQVVNAGALAKQPLYGHVPVWDDMKLYPHFIQHMHIFKFVSTNTNRWYYAVKYNATIFTLIHRIGLDWIEQGLTSLQTHYRSYQGRVSMGQMTQPTVSKHWRKIGPKDYRAHNKSMHSDMGQCDKTQSENCKNCSSKCAYDCAQLKYTIQNRTVLIISPLTSRQTS